MIENNIHTQADGIVGTHVTWGDIEHDMQDALHTKATFGKNKTATNIGDGNGFMSKICLIEPDWQNVEESGNLPQKFIAKLSTALTILAFSKEICEQKQVENTFSSEEKVSMVELKVRSFHNTEVNVYNLLEKHNAYYIPRPKIFCSKPYETEQSLKGYILMEFIEDIASVHIYNTLTPKDLHQALKVLAALHAVGFRFNEKELQLFTQNPLQDIFGAFFDDDMVDKVPLMFSAFGGEKMKTLSAQFTKASRELIKLKFYDELPDQLGMKRVLSHGDLWSTNILWHRNDDELQIASLIDFQTAHLGNPAGDLVRIFCTCLSGRDRQENEEHLLSVYYDYLVDELGNSHQVPFSLEALKEAYKRYLPIGGYLVVPMLGSFFEVFVKNLEENERKRILDIVTEKMEALLEDMLKNHQRNKDLGLL